jgi:hypothetical protein
MDRNKQIGLISAGVSSTLEALQAPYPKPFYSCPM